jgi:hypothetical protein
MTADLNSDKDQRKHLSRVAALAVLSGLAIAWLDSRQDWDDTGISAGVILLTSGSFTAIRPAYPWLWALAVGSWIPVFEITTSQNYGSLLALAVAFLGAYGAATVLKTIRLFR